MKRIFIFALISVLLISLTACSKKKNNNSESFGNFSEESSIVSQKESESYESSSESDSSSIMDDISEIESVFDTDERDYSKWYCEEVPSMTSFYMGRPNTNFYIDNHEFVLGYDFESFLENGWEATDYNPDDVLAHKETREFELTKEGKSITVTVKNIYDEDDFPIESAAFTGIKLKFNPESYIDFSSPHNIPLGYQVQDWELESNNLRIDSNPDWVESKNEDGSCNYTLHEEGVKDGWNYKLNITYIFDGKVFIGFEEDFDQWLDN